MCCVHEDMRLVRMSTALRTRVLSAFLYCILMTSIVVLVWNMLGACTRSRVRGRKYSFGMVSNCNNWKRTIMCLVVVVRGPRSCCAELHTTDRHKGLMLLQLRAWMSQRRGLEALSHRGAVKHTTSRRHRRCSRVCSVAPANTASGEPALISSDIVRPVQYHQQPPTGLFAYPITPPPHPFTDCQSLRCQFVIFNHFCGFAWWFQKLNLLKDVFWDKITSKI